MDYLDPAKQARHRIILFTGYILIAIGIVIGTDLLVTLASGYGLGKNGTIIQNGLIYFSSQPNPATIHISGVQRGTTNTRLYLPEGTYSIDLSRPGYYDWQRIIEVIGGQIEHYDYPFLFPKTLTTTKIGTSYAQSPTLVTQSPDRRWLIVGEPSAFGTFDMYDLNNPTTAPTQISLPSAVLSKATGSESWQLLDWADDNDHFILIHSYDGKTEYILVNRTNPSQSVNLTNLYSLTNQTLSLINEKYDKYYIYDPTSKNLISTTLEDTTRTMVETNVLAYQSYNNNTVLYMTDDKAPTGKVLLKILSGGQNYTLHSFDKSPTYLLNLTGYNGILYVVASAASTNKVYIYKDPLGQLAATPNDAVSPIQVLRVNSPNYVSFSDNAQYIMAESSNQFAVYDLENQKGYDYTTRPLDAPQVHANWMDGNRIDFISGGKIDIFDYDHTNQHILVDASSAFEPFFSQKYDLVFHVSTNASSQYELDQTDLLAPADR